jgi:hypothetical protein
MGLYLLQYKDRRTRGVTTLSMDHEPWSMVQTFINRKEYMELKSTAKFQIVEDNKHEPDLKSAQQFVGGMVQGIEFPNGDYMIMNEEGKLLGLEVNEQATKLWRETFTKDKYLFGYNDFVCGPVIYIKKQALKRWAA